MADRPNQPPRDLEVFPEEPGGPRDREPGELGEVAPGETREPALGDTGLGGPGVGDPLAPQQPGGAPGVPPGPLVGEPPTPEGMGEPAPGGERFGLGGEAGATAAESPRTGEPIEPKSGGESFVDSVKDAFRQVKDAVTPDDKAGDEEAPSGHLPQEPQEGRGGGLR